MTKNFPEEIYFNIEKNRSLELRVTVNLGIGDLPFWVEVDLVDSANKKIITHIGKATSLEDRNSAINCGMHLFRKWRAS